MKKKVMALVLAGIMTVGASMTTFAADTPVTDSTTATEVTGTGQVKLPTLKVTVPTAFDVVLNPFQLAYEDADGNKYKTQIVTVPQIIKNESDVAVAINIKEFKAAPAGEAKVVQKTVGRATDKSVYLYLEVVNVASDDASAAKFTGTGLVPGDDTTQTSKDAVVTLGAISDTVEATYAAFKLGGDMVVNPVDENGEADPWVAADKVDVSFKITFTPQMAAGR